MGYIMFLYLMSFWWCLCASFCILPFGSCAILSHWAEFIYPIKFAFYWSFRLEFCGDNPSAAFVFFHLSPGLSLKFILLVYDCICVFTTLNGPSPSFFFLFWALLVFLERIELCIWTLYNSQVLKLQSFFLFRSLACLIIAFLKFISLLSYLECEGNR